jgi:hypothetical protein
MKHSSVLLICSFICVLLTNNHVVQGKKIRTPLRGSIVKRSLEYDTDESIRHPKKTLYPTFSPSDGPRFGPTPDFFSSDEENPSDNGPPMDVSEPVPSENNFDLIPPFFAPASPPNSDPNVPRLPPTNEPVAPPNETPVRPTIQPVDPPSGSPNQMPADDPQGAPITSPAGSSDQTPTDSSQGSPVASPVGTPNQTPTDAPQSAPNSSPAGSPDPTPTGAPQGPPNSSPTGPPNPTPTDASQNPPTTRPVGPPTPSPTIFPSLSSIASSEPTPVHSSCLAAQNGGIYATPDSIVVTYEYEVLTGVNRMRNEVAQAVDDGFQGFLAKSLVDCSMGSNSDVQGISPGTPDTFAGGTCDSISFFDPATDVCYKMNGSVEVYLSATSTLTSLEIQDLVWSALRTEINESRRILEETRRRLLSSLINEDKGIIALYFVSSADNTDSISGGDLNANDVGENSDGVGPAISAALVGILIFVVAILGFIFIQRKRSDDDTIYNQDTTFDRSRAATLEEPENIPVLMGARPKRFSSPGQLPAFSPVLEVSESERDSATSAASPLSTYEYPDSSTPPNDQTQVSYTWSQLGASMILSSDQMLQWGVIPSNTSPSTLSSIFEKYERSATISPSLTTLGNPSIEGTSAGSRTPKTPSSKSRSRSETPTSSNISSSAPDYTPGKSPVGRIALLSNSVRSSPSENEASHAVKTTRKFGTSRSEYSGSGTDSPPSTSSLSSDSGKSSDSAKTNTADILRWTNGAQSSPEADTSSSGESSRSFIIDHTGIVKPIPVRSAGLSVRPKVGTSLSRSAHMRSPYDDKENEMPMASNPSFNRNLVRQGLATRSNIPSVENQIDDRGTFGTTKRTKSPAALRPPTSHEPNKAAATHTATNDRHASDDSFMRMKQRIHSTNAFDLEMGRSATPEARLPFTTSETKMIRSSSRISLASRGDATFERRGSYRQDSPSTNSDQQTAERSESSRRGRSRTRSRTPVNLAGSDKTASDGTPARSKTPDTRKVYTRRSSRSKTPDNRKQYTSTPGSSSRSVGKPRTPSTPGSSRGPYAAPDGVSMAGTSMSSVPPAVLRYSEVSSASKGVYESNTVQF